MKNKAAKEEYGRDDDTLLRLAARIKARAIRRAGELLREFDGRDGRNLPKSGGAPTFSTQRQAAKDAGLSKDQQVTAVRVAKVPKELFEELVEGR